MTLKASIGAAVASGVVALACVGPAAGAYGDAHDRSTAASGSPSTYSDAVDRAVRNAIHTPTDRGTYLDGHDRGALPAGGALVSATSKASDFSWGAALGGAGVALFVVGLVSIVLVMMRRGRRPIAAQ
jgi:hypothetical protein